MQDPINSIYCIGSVVGPHPFPMMVRDFQRVVGIEAKEQFLDMTGELPDSVVACVGGGSNAMGYSRLFLEMRNANYMVWNRADFHLILANTRNNDIRKPGMIHGFKCYVLQDEKGEPSPVYSVASGLDYPVLAQNIRC